MTRPVLTDRFTVLNRQQAFKGRVVGRRRGVVVDILTDEADRAVAEGKVCPTAGVT